MSVESPGDILDNLPATGRGMGDNSGAIPLEVVLVEETAELRQRVVDLIAAAQRGNVLDPSAKITDQETAEKATVLAKMMKDHVTKIDEARTARKDPFLRDGRTVDQHFGSIASDLAVFDGKKKLIGGPLATVLWLIDGYRRDQEAKAAAERRRLEEEARVQREAAEAAARAQREAEERERLAAIESTRKVREAEEAAAQSANKAVQEAAARARAEQARQEAEASQRRMAAELEQRRLEERQAATERAAAAAVAKPIDTGVGVKASGRAVTVVTITDWKKAAKHALKMDEAEMQAAIQKIYDRLARAKITDLPGATVTKDSTTQIR